MVTQIIKRNKGFIVLLSLILIVGFLTTSLVSYFISLSSLRDEITSSSLPLTSDNVYSEIQRDLIMPVFISSMMANDTFLRDWILDGERDEGKITKFLNEIMQKYGAFTSFFVSEATRIYYHADGILKKVDPEEERDVWYFRVREMKPDYEINVDPDLANKDELTIFINHKMYDYSGRFIGVTGVGLTVRSLFALMADYSRKYNRNVYLTGQDGKIMLSSTSYSKTFQNIRDIEGISSIAGSILSTDSGTYRYSLRGRAVHLNSRFVPELKWYLLVEQTEEGSTKGIHNALVINLIMCALITAIVLAITIITVNAYQKINLNQHVELREKNESIERALAEVNKLSGLLPICSSCKKIRDDKGCWWQLESYIRDHSEADFTHGICPDCAQKLYGDFLGDRGGVKPPKK